MKKDLHGKSFAIVRPNHFLYAACDMPDQLDQISMGIQQTLGLIQENGVDSPFLQFD